MRFIDEIHVKERSNSIKIFEVFDYYSERITDIITANKKLYEESYDIYRKGAFADAAVAYAELKKQQRAADFVERNI